VKGVLNYKIIPLFRVVYVNSLFFLKQFPAIPLSFLLKCRKRISFTIRAKIYVNLIVINNKDSLLRLNLVS
jgi:hypothetical protein